MIAKDARFYVYFLTEGYKDQAQSNLYTEVTRRIEDFGLATGKEVAVVMPHAGFEEATLGEVRDDSDSRMQELYREQIYGETPGLLVTVRPISDPRAHEGAMFFSLAHVVHPIREARRIVGNVSEAAKAGRLRSALMSINKFIKLEPNLFGLGFNLNKAIEAVLEKKGR